MSQGRHHSESDIDLVVAWRQGSGYQFGTVKTSDAFQKRLTGVAEKADKALATLTRHNYSIGDEIEDDEYMVSPLARHQPLATSKPQARDVMVPIEERERARKPAIPKPATTRDPLDFRRRLITTMRNEAPVGASFLRQRTIAFYAIVRGSIPEDRVAYVRHLNPMRLMKTGAIIAALGDSLDDMTHPVFAMDDRTDLIIRSSDVAIFDKNFFDSLFFDLSGDGSNMDKIVAETLSVLKIIPETIAMLVERSRGRKRMRRKMLEIRETNHLEKVTSKDLKKALTAEGIPHSRFIRKDGKIYSSEADSELLLQILNEDLFHGALTGRALSATRKNVRK